MFYVRVATRGINAGAKGSPRQAINYITDGHDMRRDPGYSDAELAYIARLDPGWKTDLEGGRVPLVGFGQLSHETDERKMAAGFEEACLPADSRGTTGYKSITFTLPKEMSLFAEGHREQAKAAMYAAIRSTLEAAFGDRRYTAVAAIHTRNDSGEIHYHAHVLVAKFAEEPDTGRIISLNSKRGGNGPRRVHDLKVGWREAVEKEFRARLQLGIEQRTRNAAPTLVMPDGTRLAPLNRACRRELERDIAPWYSAPTGSGPVVQRQLRLGAMDARIFEVASGKAGRGWSRDEFQRLFPDQARFADRYEKRVETLRSLGYLTAAGTVTPEFRLHFSVRHGIDTPELQRLRIDLARKVVQFPRQPRVTSSADRFWRELDKQAHLRARIERLGFSKDDFRRLLDDAALRKPTPERLAQLRAVSAVRALAQPSTSLPATKTVVRAFVQLQRARLQRVYLVVKGAATFNLAENRKLAAAVFRAAERDYRQAKDRRLAEIARGLRPIFGAVRVLLPRQAKRLERAVERCARLAYSQEVRQLRREEVRRAYLEWRQQFIERPREELKRAARDLELPAQQSGRAELDGARTKLALSDAAAARDMYKRGYEALRSLGRPDAVHLRPWVGREDALVRAVFERAKSGAEGMLRREEYQAAVRAGQVGRLLTREEQGRARRIANGTEHTVLERLGRRLDALGIRSPIETPAFKSLAPSEVQKSIEAFRKAGLLDDGPGWTLRAGPARGLAQDLGRAVDRAVEAERLLTDALLKKRSRHD